MSVIQPKQVRLPGTDQRGFTLLEVLITVVIFSVGLLGIAGLQMSGMKQTHNSHLRSVATTQAMEMADRMRANKAGVENGDYDQAPTSCTADCAGGACTPAQLAEYDMCEWGNETVAALPNSVATVCLDASPAPATTASDWGTSWECSGTGNIYAVKIQWTERTLDDRDQGATVAARRHFYLRVTL